MIDLQPASRIRALSHPSPQSATFRVLKPPQGNLPRLRLPSLQRDHNRVLTEPSQPSIFPQQITMARKLLLLIKQQSSLRQNALKLKELRTELAQQFNDIRLTFDQALLQLTNSFHKHFKALRRAIRLEGTSCKQQQSQNSRGANRVGCQLQELSELSKETSRRVQSLVRQLTGHNE